MKKNKVNRIIRMKGKSRIACLTSYSKNMTEIIDKHCDIILVGDSLGMVLYGMRTTKEMSLDVMIKHASTVKKFTKKSLVVVDMPFNTYRNKLSAFKNASKIIKYTKCDAVKLEGGKKIFQTVKYLVDHGISVMGHIGLLPQTSSKYKVKGKNESQKRKILNDALSITKAGAFAIVVECVVENLAKKITKKINIPTIGIGASKDCDGQILVTDDMLGLSNFAPKFVKKYSNLRKIVEKSVKEYTIDVKYKRFPSIKNVYKH